MCKSCFEIRSKNKRNLAKRFCTKICSSRFNGLANKGIKQSLETRKKKSAVLSGEQNPFYGKSHSEETLKKLSEMKKGQSWEERFGTERANKLKEQHSKLFSGERNPFFGRTHSEQSRKLISENHRDSAGSNNPMFGKGHLVEKENNPAWLGGISFEDYGTEFNDNLKTKIRLRDKFVCFVCKQHGHVIHHIDYEKKNNDERNLITLCNSCHGKTNFNRENWISFFRVEHE